MPMVYVVTEGCYSDRDIAQVFSTKEKAEAYIVFRCDVSRKLRMESHLRLLQEVENNTGDFAPGKWRGHYTLEQKRDAVANSVRWANASDDAIIGDQTFSIHEFLLDEEYVPKEPS